MEHFPHACMTSGERLMYQCAQQCPRCLALLPLLLSMTMWHHLDITLLLRQCCVYAHEAKAVFSLRLRAVFGNLECKRQDCECLIHSLYTFVLCLQILRQRLWTSRLAIAFLTSSPSVVLAWSSTRSPMPSLPRRPCCHSECLVIFCEILMGMQGYSLHCPWFYQGSPSVAAPAGHALLVIFFLQLHMRPSSTESWIMSFCVGSQTEHCAESVISIRLLLGRGVSWRRNCRSDHRFCL